MSKRENILALSCSHMPFEHKYFLDFIIETYNKEKCNRIVHLGDIVDNHSISYHEHDPNGDSPEAEMKTAAKHLERWFRAFPKMYVCVGNHDCLVDRKAKTAGLPSRTFKNLREIWKFPKGWQDAYEWILDDVMFQHGTNRSGNFAHLQAAHDNRQSTVIGHLHTNAGVEWTANSKDIIFGMVVGCGIDRQQYAFNYGRDFKRKPILGCGIVTDGGAQAEFIPMDLGKKVIYTNY